MNRFDELNKFLCRRVLYIAMYLVIGNNESDVIFHASVSVGLVVVHCVGFGFLPYVHVATFLALSIQQL